MFEDFTKIEKANSRYIMFSHGKGRVSNPNVLYTIVETATNRTLNVGSRKHIVETWNTSFNFSTTRSFSA